MRLFTSCEGMTRSPSASRPRRRCGSSPRSPRCPGSPRPCRACPARARARARSPPCAPRSGRRSRGRPSRGPRPRARPTSAAPRAPPSRPRLMSSSLAFGASASFSPVTGETISRASSPVASTQSPATKFCSVFTAVAIPSPAPRVDPVPRLVEHLAQDTHHLVELLRPGDERRRELRARLAAVVEAHVDAELARAREQERLDQIVALGRRERLLRVLVLHELEE